MWFDKADEQPIDAELACALSPDEIEAVGKIAGPALMDYFGIAVAIERAHAAQYLGDLCPTCKEDVPLCACQAFDESRAEADAEELRLFDRAEARAINSGAW